MSYGPLMLDLPGLTLSPEDREILEHPHVGGVILFSRNVEAPAQLTELTTALRQAARKPLLIAVDQEGGRVQRLREGFTRLPAPGAVLAACGGDKRAAAFQHRELGWLMASEVRAVGCDLSFAPVLDLGRGISAVIGDRAFADNAAAIVQLAGAYIAGMNEAGMAACGKHFPGHGSTELDSHIAMPVDSRSRAAIVGEDMQAFYALMQGPLAAVMPAHVIYPEVDDRPACFSPVWLQRILREQCQFEGAVFSDDLSMAGAAQIGDYPERARAALAAGCDMVLACNNRAGAVAILDRLQFAKDSERERRLARMQAWGSASTLDALRTHERARAIRSWIAATFPEF